MAGNETYRHKIRSLRYEVGLMSCVNETRLVCMFWEATK